MTMPDEIETARRIAAGELASLVDQCGLSVLPDLLAMIEEQLRKDHLDAWRHCESEAVLEPIRTAEHLARELRIAAEMYALLGKRELAAATRKHAAGYRRKARAALRKWRPSFRHQERPTLDL